MSVETKIENVRRRLEHLLQDLGEIPAGEIPAFLIQLSACQTALAARMSTATTAHDGHEPVVKDQLLSAEQAAGILGVTRQWLYRHSGQLPFTRRLSRKVLRFSEVSLRKWMAAQKKS